MKRPVPQPASKRSVSADTGVHSAITQDEVLGGNQTLDTVGASLNWQLFAGGAIASAVRQSRALFRESQANYEATKRSTETQTRAAFRGIVTGIQRIAAARSSGSSGALRQIGRRKGQPDEAPHRRHSLQRFFAAFGPLWMPLIQSRRGHEFGWVSTTSKTVVP